MKKTTAKKVPPPPGLKAPQQLNQPQNYGNQQYEQL